MVARLAVAALVVAATLGVVAGTVHADHRVQRACATAGEQTGVCAAP